MFGNDLPQFNSLMPDDPAINRVANSPVRHGGMFAAGSTGNKILNALSAFATSASAGMGNPAAMQSLQAQQQRRLMQQRLEQEQQQYQKQRTDKMDDWRTQYDYEIGHPKPVNNDTAADYEFWQQRLSPEQFQTWLSNKVNPPRFMTGPNGEIVQIPMSGQGMSPPSAPIGKLTPVNGGQTPPASGTFQY